eukprot:14695271-Alexandrium_andersonii.AAC.1
MVAGSPSDVEFYEMPIPGHLRTDPGRQMLQIPVIPPHEALHEEICENQAELFAELEARISSQSLP